MHVEKDFQANPLMQTKIRATHEPGGARGEVPTGQRKTRVFAAELEPLTSPFKGRWEAFPLVKTRGDGILLNGFEVLGLASITTQPALQQRFSAEAWVGIADGWLI